MSRMLDALRRLEAAELLVAPPAPSAVVVDDDPQSAADEANSIADGDAVLSVRPAAPLSRIARDEVPFEPVFSPLSSWEDNAAYVPATFDYELWDDAAAESTDAVAPIETEARESEARDELCHDLSAPTSLAEDVLTKIGQAEELAAEAAQEEPPEVRWRSQTIEVESLVKRRHQQAKDDQRATHDSAQSSGEAAADIPRRDAITLPLCDLPTIAADASHESELCSQSWDELVELRDEAVVPTDVDDSVAGEARTFDAKMTQPMFARRQWPEDDAHPREESRETSDESADATSESPADAPDAAADVQSAPFEWEDLFPDVALDKAEAVAEGEWAVPLDDQSAMVVHRNEATANDGWDGESDSAVDSPQKPGAEYSVLSTTVDAGGESALPDAANVAERDSAIDLPDISLAADDEPNEVPPDESDFPAEQSVGEEQVVDESSPVRIETITPDAEPAVAWESHPEQSSTETETEAAAAQPATQEGSLEVSGDSSEEISSESDESKISADTPTQSEPTSTASPKLDTPDTSGAERAALADLGDPELAKQYVDLGKRVLCDLGKTTHPSAVLVGAEHQPHVTDVTLRTALSLALAGRQILVVDAALADKHLTSGLGLSAEVGLSETLKGRVPWQQAVRATATPGLCVLPAGRITPPQLSEGDERLDGLLKELASQWELVLLDAGSCHDSSAGAVLKSARNVYLLVRLGETQTAAAAAAVAIIEKTGAKLRGCVATNA